MRSSRSPSRTRGPDATVHGGGADSGGVDDGGGGGGGGDDLVKVAYAPNDAEAQMIQGLLSEHGIPSLIKGALGFADSQFPAIGPRDVFVTADAAERARQILEGITGAR
jgi:putative signal transducing protein